MRVITIPMIRDVIINILEGSERVRVFNFQWHLYRAHACSSVHQSSRLHEASPPTVLAAINLVDVAKFQASTTGVSKSVGKYTIST